MLLEKPNKNILKYKLKSQNKIKTSDTTKNDIIKLEKKYNLIKECMEFQYEAYEIVSKDFQKSYIYINSNQSSKNLFHLPTKIFDLLSMCKNITFDYEPRSTLNQVVKINFKYIIDNTISLIGIVYQIILKFSASNNFYLYISFLIEILDIHYIFLNQYNKILKVKSSLGNNLDFIFVTNDKLAFGMIDPQGCLINHNDNFDFKNISFKPIVDSSNEILISKEQKLNIIATNNISIEPNINKKWITKIVSNPNSLHIINNNLFCGKGNIKEALKNLGYSFTKI